MNWDLKLDISSIMKTGRVSKKYTEIGDLTNKIGLDIDIEGYYQDAKNEGIK